jgi:predicted oxidoreductase
MDPAVLEATVAKFNAAVDGGKDEFNRTALNFKIEKPPFYAAWATPILHDTLTGLHTDRDAQVVDRAGEAIPGLYCAGESMGGFAQHGLARCIIFGRVAGRHAAKLSV